MTHIYDGDWETLKRKLCMGDVIEVNSIQELFENYQDFDRKVSLCTQFNIVLKMDNHFIEMSVFHDLLSYVFYLKNEELKCARNKGIEKALEKKRCGKGKYGRPCIDIPKEFNKMIVLYEQGNKPLEEYRKQINMKRSTFYKYAKKAKAVL